MVGLKSGMGYLFRRVKREFSLKFMNNNKYALAIVGYGGMGSWHAELIKDFDNLFVYGIYDIKEERREAAKKQGYKVFDSLDEVCENKDVDIVLIATPNDFHKPIAIKAMEAGKNVVSEKPVTLSSTDLQEMIVTANRCGVVFTVHQNRRWDGDFRTAKKIYDDRLLGEVFKIESRVHGSRGIPGDWRGKKEHGGGMILDWGVHILDQMLIMIPEKIKKVYATLTHVTNAEVDDGFTVYLTFESGKTALLEVGTSNFINLPRWYIEGENGTAEITDFNCNGKIICVKSWADKDVKPVKTAAGLTKTMAPRTEETVVELPLPVVQTDIHDFYKNVVAAIEGKEQQLISHSELMRVMKLMEAIFESAEKAQVVDFE